MKKLFEGLLCPGEKFKKLLIMAKLSMLMMLFCLQLSAGVYSQQIRVKLKMNNTTLEKIFLEIEKNSEYSFIYDATELGAIEKAKVDFNNADLKDILSFCLENTAYEYEIFDKHILIKKSKHTQQTDKVVVKGFVTDSKGNPLPGVTVIIKGTSIGVATNVKGGYTISFPRMEKTVLVYSFVGMKTKELVYTGKQFVDVTLEDDSKALDDVVVTGYYKRSKESFTGSVKRVSGEDILKISSSNVLTALSSIDPSFQLLENNEMGSDPNTLPEFQLRGTSNINIKNAYTGNPNRPIFILDGFEVDMQKIFDMNPSLIASITILKDATATAIYGSKAANGVVVVESKMPKSGKVNVSYSMNSSVSVPDLSVYDLMNAEEKLELERQTLYKYKGQAPSDFQDLQRIYNEKLAMLRIGVDTDWLHQPLDKFALNTSHSVNINGGEGNFRYGVNLFHNSNNGVMKGSERKRNSLDLFIGYRHKKLNIQTKVSLAKVKANNSPYGSFGAYARMNPYLPSKIDGNVYAIWNWDANPLNNTVNPLWNASLNTVDNNINQNVIINFDIDYSLSENFKIRSSISYTNISEESNKFLPANHTNFIIATAGNNLPGSYEYSTLKRESFTARLMLNYYKQFGDNVLSFNAGVDVNSNEDNTLGFMATGFPNERLDHMGFAFSYAQDSKPTGAYLVDKAMGIIGSANYSIKNKYLFDASIKFDGSSKFGSNNRWGNFWAVGLGWNVHNESFLADNSIINKLKLKASHGFTGSQSFDPYQALTTFEFISDKTYYNAYGAKVKTLANKDLKWQRTLKTNAGIETSLLNNYLNIGVDVYRELTKDALIDLTLAPSSGFSTYKINLGEIENIGMEVSLSSTIIRNVEKNLGLTVFATASRNKNKLLKMNDSLQAWNEKQDEDYKPNVFDDIVRNRPVVRFAEGQSMSTVWAVKSLGIDPTTGKELFLNKEGEITDLWSTDDYIAAGDSRPELMGSFGAYLNYKKWQLNINMRYSMGADIYNRTLVEKVENVNLANNADRRVLTSRWKQPGDKAQFKGVNEIGQTLPTTRLIQEENYINCTSINLTYSMDNSFVKKLGMQNLRISAYTNDLFRISTIKQERGTSYPFARSFTLNLTALF